jgi:hypothetical protein
MLNDMQIQRQQNTPVRKNNSTCFNTLHMCVYMQKENKKNKNKKFSIVLPTPQFRYILLRSGHVQAIRTLSEKIKTTLIVLI